jgi:menaquinone-dependent protoporphyrinogen oxidase
MNVLVGYASAHGSTAEIAQEIGRILAEYGNEVTVANVADVQDASKYDAFVLGSAIHAGMWLTEMSQFITRAGDRVAARPFYYFMTCIRVLEDFGYEHVIANYINHQIMDRLRPREIVAFAGKLEMSAVDWDERWTLSARYDGSGIPGSYNNDFRDWDKIRDWARHVGDDLRR